MLIFPAIDLKNGQVVRLYKGDFATVHQVAEDPVDTARSFASAGAQVKKGDALCLIEAMKMMSEVPAPADCVVEEVLAKDGEAVGMGAPLFRIRRV